MEKVGDSELIETLDPTNNKSDDLDKKNSVLATNLRKIIILHEPPIDVSTCPKNSPSLSDTIENNINKNTRVIELSDKKKKQELRREFVIDEHDIINNNNNNENDGLQKNSSASVGELRYCKKIMDDKGNEIFIVPKLPPGTVLIKQANNNNENVNEPSNDLLNKLDLRRVEKSTFGIAKQFISPPKKRNSQVRRNPSRGIKKKIEDDDDDDDFPRPRLISLKRRAVDDHYDLKYTKKQMKNSDVPYMNTRSITKKLYNVGATHETPNIRDEIEWKDWPAHGMHERPVYHPQVGNAVECTGRCFTSLDNYSYHEISQNSSPRDSLPLSRPPDHHIPRYTDEQNNKSKSIIEESFEKCMHNTFHAVLAFSSQIMTSQYEKIEEKINKVTCKKQKIDDNLRQTSDKQNDNCLDKSNESDNLKNIDQLNSFNLSSVQNKNNQEINKNINFIDKLKTSKTVMQNHKKLQLVLERGTKNTLILLKTNSEQLVKKDDSQIVINSNSGLNKFSVNEENEEKIENDKVVNFSEEEGKSCEENLDLNEKINAEETDKYDWLKQLIGNTAILYCAAVGIDQDNLVNYLDSLDTRQCLDWIKLGY